MENDQLKQYVEQIVDQKLNAMNNLTIPYHQHNGYDNSRLDPAIALLGFPVQQVSSATAAPSFVADNGTFIFQVDTSPKYALWAYLVYNNAGSLTGGWKGIQLTL